MTVAQLGDQLVEHLRAVESGDEVVVMVEGRPIARIIPMTARATGPRLIPPTLPFATVRDRVRPRVDLGISSTDLLLEERGDR
ncbi:MAG: hypothetical protein U0869_15880 [Chloroflexota bacterium]